LAANAAWAARGAVLEQGRDAEDPDDALADRPRQLPSVPFQGGAELGLGPFEHDAERLGVEARAGAGRDPQLGAERRIAVSSSPRAGAGSSPSSSSSSRASR
jgi:hypothetical protein